MTPHVPGAPHSSGAQRHGAHEPRLYRVVAQRIERYILQHQMAPGARLPPERELASLLGVSRASLREALIALELGGAIEVRGGSGAYVREPAPAPAEAPHTGPGPFELLFARSVIEVEVAALAARNASAAALDAILQAVLAMEHSHADRASNELADRHFHMAIASATGNPALVGVVGYLWDQRGSLWHRLKHHYRTEQLRHGTLTDHRAILGAIAARDTAGARLAMRAHLQRVTHTLCRD